MSLEHNDLMLTRLVIIVLCSSQSISEVVSKIPKFAVIYLLCEVQTYHHYTKREHDRPYGLCLACFLR